MRILVKVKPSSKFDRVTPPPAKLLPEAGDPYVVETREKPVQGKATEAVMRLLAEHFGVARSRVRLVSGGTSRKKLFEISGV